VVRTMSKQEIPSMLAPVEGRIWLQNGVPRRDPWSRRGEGDRRSFRCGCPATGVRTTRSGA
jgi:hypothetical protein